MNWRSFLFSLIGTVVLLLLLAGIGMFWFGGTAQDSVTRFAGYFDRFDAGIIRQDMIGDDLANDCRNCSGQSCLGSNHPETEIFRLAMQCFLPKQPTGQVAENNGKQMRYALGEGD